jgi:glycosyltransferase involved in cell wall biosynthesis
VGNGPALAALRRLAVDLGVESRVVFHGQLNHNQVLRQLRAANLFCLPTSASEGFPKAVLEALACGLPVITTRVSVLPHLLDGGGGILLEEASSAAVARAVHTCLRNPVHYSTMSERALRTAHNYSLERWRDMIGDLARRAWGPLGSDA